MPTLKYGHSAMPGGRIRRDMKTFFKLLVVVIVLNAAVHGGLSAKRYFQLKQAAQEAVLFGAATPVTDIHQIIIERAQALNMPVVRATSMTASGSSPLT